MRFARMEKLRTGSGETRHSDGENYLEKISVFLLTPKTEVVRYAHDKSIPHGGKDDDKKRVREKSF